MKKALLKDSNMALIKKFELNYFQECYGAMFNSINEIEVSPLLKYESFIYSNL